MAQWQLLPSWACNPSQSLWDGRSSTLTGGAGPEHLGVKTFWDFTVSLSSPATTPVCVHAYMCVCLSGVGWKPKHGLYSKCTVYTQFESYVLIWGAWESLSHPGRWDLQLSACSIASPQSCTLITNLLLTLTRPGRWLSRWRHFHQARWPEFDTWAPHGGMVE